MSLIAAYLNQTVTIVPRTGRDANGASVYGAGAATAARVQQRKRLVRNELGQQVLSDMQIFLAPGTDVAEGYRITYAGGTYQVLSVSTEQGIDEVSHLVAWTGRVGTTG